MSPFKVTGLCLSLLALSGCGGDAEPPQSPPPTATLTHAERLPPVELKIPGVGSDSVEVATLPVVATDEATQAASNTEPDSASKDPLPVPTLDIPRPLLLSDAVHTRFRSLLQGPSAMPILDAVFYPLGWSTDGKFAYAIEPPDEAIGSYFLNVYIQDLVTDKILWKDEYQSEPESNKGIQSFAAYWMANETAMNARLKQYGIDQTHENALLGGPVHYNDDLIRYEVKKTLKEQADFGNLAMVTQYQVDVISKDRGQKSVHKETYTKHLSVLDVDVLGYIRGKDPERAALLIAGVRRGWEGPPHVTWFKIVGTNLRRGFKK